MDIFSSGIHIFSQLVLLLLALDHLITGIVGLCSPERSLMISKKLFGLEISDTATYRLFIRPWAALGIFAGLVGLLPLYDIRRFYPILYFIALLLLFRVFYRLKFMVSAEKELSLSKKRNIVHVALILVCFFAIVGQIIILL